MSSLLFFFVPFFLDLQKKARHIGDKLREEKKAKKQLKAKVEKKAEQPKVEQKPVA